jgi:hypothetical protein
MATYLYTEIIVALTETLPDWLQRAPPAWPAILPLSNLTARIWTLSFPFPVRHRGTVSAGRVNAGTYSGAYLLLYLMILQYIFDLGRKRVKTKALHGSERTIESRDKMPTLRAAMMCSGAIVFFDSPSHISLASDDIR